MTDGPTITPADRDLLVIGGGLNDLPTPRSMIERVLATTMSEKRKVPKPGLLTTTMLFPSAAACQLFVE